MVFLPVGGAGAQKADNDKGVDGQFESPVLRILHNVPEENIDQEGKKQTDEHGYRKVYLNKIRNQAKGFLQLPHNRCPPILTVSSI
jgi:hypothetical protein